MSDSTQSLMNMSLSNGRYELVSRIGTGGMARVFKGYDTNLDRDVAVKILHEHLADDVTFKERFEREAKFVAGLNHPNIVQIYDFDSFMRDGQRIYYMVMSFVPGSTLQAKLEKLRHENTMMSHDDVLRLMQQMADALGYAHNHGAIHRDVKPANILIDDNDNAILTDFGIARLAEGSQLTQEGLTVGTPTYMSPEQATGEMVDSRSDLYALGIILYEMLAGTPPFADDGTLSVLLKHLNEPVPSLLETHHIGNPGLDAVIYKALAKNPEYRYQTADEFTTDLQLACAGAKPRAKTAPVPQINPASLVPDSATVVVSTPEFNTAVDTPVAQVAAAAVQPQQRFVIHAPLGILIVGLLIIGGLLFVGLINRDDGTTAAAETPQTSEVETGIGDDFGNADSMTGEEVSDSMTGELFFASTFDDNEAFADYWPQGNLDMLVREITDDGFYRIESTLQDRAVATIFEEYTYENVTIQIEGSLSEASSNTSAYGIIFRYVDNNNYNVFAVDGSGRFSIWVREEGRWTELRDMGEDWSGNEVINRRGNTNMLTVDIMGNQFIGAVNGEVVATVMDDTISDGMIGIYIASPPGGNTTALIDRYEAMPSQFSAVDSMTGEDYEATPEANNNE